MYDRTILETLDYHRSMLTDKVRMQSYLQAIMKTVKPGDVVLDIGSGTNSVLGLTPLDVNELVANVPTGHSAVVVREAHAESGEEG